MTDHTIGTREEWQAARDELLRLEKEHTRMGDDLARKRRELPWVPVEKAYRFDTDDGTRTLVELFDGRSQLLVYHFMFGPSYEAGCPTCSSSADAVNAVLPHLRARDVTMLYVSRAPIDRLLAYEDRMGWTFPWVSCGNNDFNFDLGFSYTDEQVRAFAGPMLEGDAPAGVEAARRRGRLPHVLDPGARPRVPDGLLPDPRSGAEGARRGRGAGALAPPARRVLASTARSSGRSGSAQT
jgi:hypothetical protein